MTSPRLLAVLLAACLGQTLVPAAPADLPTVAPQLLASSEAAQLPRFLYDRRGTSGWARIGGTALNYCFIKDGRLVICGPDGEATLWEGSWRLQGNKLTLRNKDLKTTKTVTVAISGADLLLDNVRYKRNRY